MPRALRRLTAAATSFILAVGGVALAAAPAQAAEYVPTGTWNIQATGVDWGDDVIFDTSDTSSIFALIPDATSFTLQGFEWRRGDNDAVLGYGFTYTVTGAAAGAGIYAALRGTINGGSMDGYTATLYSNRTNVIPVRTFSQPTLSVSGTAIAGNALTVAGGGWGATPTSYNWEWRRVSDNALVGSGTGSTVGGYTVTSADVAAGSIFYGIVTAHLLGYADATWATSFSQAAHLGSFAGVTATPSVVGTGRLGSSFTASLDTTGIVPAPTTVAYRWHTTDGTIVGAGATFTPTNALLGQPLYATAVLSRADYSDYATLGSAYTATVALAQFENVSQPTVGGTGRLGSSFTAYLDTSGITPTPATVTFRWHTTDGTIVGAGATFTPTNALLGQPLYATALLSAVDTADYGTLGSAYTATVSLADQTPGAAPVIEGRNVLGGVLTASVDTSAWSPVPDSFDYQWYLEDGTAIPDAAEATLHVTADLVGEVVYVVATAHAVDHFDYEIASAPTGEIAQPVLGASAASVTAGGTVTVEAWGLLLGEEYTVELHSAPLVLGAATSDAAGTISTQFTIPASTPAGAHTLVLLHDGVEVATLALTVEAAPAAPALIAATGADADLTGMTLIASLTLLAAGLMLVVSRRVAVRRSSTD
jgi:hypothetical protein